MAPGPVPARSCHHQKLMDRLRQPKRDDPLITGFTPRERGILDLIADGCTNREIGERLFLAEKTIKNHVTSILMKLGMERRTQAAVFGSTARLRAAHGSDQSPTHDRDATPRHQGG